MRLIGMLDSPYVRRVAVSLRMMDIPFELSQLSVFRQVDEFSAINPVIKAPTLVTDEGVVLMDSTLILDYLEQLHGNGRSLMPTAPAVRIRALRLIGLALAASEKTVQLVYETQLRPADKQLESWRERVIRQLNTAYGLLEEILDSPAGWLCGRRPMQPDVTVAVAWSFTRFMVADAVPAARYPRLAEFTARAEALPEFVATRYE